VPTHTIGLAIIKRDWKEAVDLILKPREGDQRDVQEAREYFAKTADAQGALDRLPHWMSIERGVLEGLAERGPAAYLNALERIPRKMRMMYVHAYQSYIWNHMCTARLTEFDRTKAILGDLVLDPALAFTAASAASAASAAEGETKESMDIEGAGDGAPDDEDAGEEEDGDSLHLDAYVKALHLVTEEDVAAERFAMTDVVLPLPGHAIQFPTHALGPRFEAKMAEDGISLEQFKNHAQSTFWGKMRWGGGDGGERGGGG
jgi:tRNA pseudouridine13 synthase